MMRGRKFFLAVAAIFSILFISSPVHAGYYSGTEKTISGVNPYGITSETNVKLTYDAPLVEVDVQFENTSVSFDESDPLSSFLLITKDPGSGMLFQLVFTPENLSGVEGPYGLNIVQGLAGGPALGSLTYTLSGENLNNSLWDIEGTIYYSEIPVPGAIWLLGSGMIGLAGLRRRFRTSE